MKDDNAIVRSNDWTNEDSQEEQQYFLRLMELSRISLRVCPKDSDGYLKAVSLVLNSKDRAEFYLAKFLGCGRGQRHLARIKKKLEENAIEGEEPCIIVKNSSQGLYIHPELASMFSVWLNAPLASMLREMLDEPEPTIGEALIGATQQYSTITKKDQRQVVYLIETSNKEFLKIGTTKNPDRRLGSLQTSNPLDLSLLFIVEGGTSLESKLLLRFADLRVRGEWFKYSKTIIAEFKRLKKEGAS